MPFIELEEPEHVCRTPGRRVGYDTTWYCDSCKLVYRYVECDPTAIQCIKGHFLDGHWQFDNRIYEED